MLSAACRFQAACLQPEYPSHTGGHTRPHAHTHTHTHMHSHTNTHTHSHISHARPYPSTSHCCSISNMLMPFWTRPRAAPISYDHDNLLAITDLQSVMRTSLLGHIPIQAATAIKLQCTYLDPLHIKLRRWKHEPVSDMSAPAIVQGLGFFLGQSRLTRQTYPHPRPVQPWMT
jgi:hypothetical protein